MNKKVMAVAAAATLLLAIALPASADPPSPGFGFAGGEIFLDDFGASNATNVPNVGDVLSGDFNSNLQYRGISDRGWLGHGLDTPGEACRGERQDTGSLWSVVDPLTAVDPPPGALSAARSVLEKSDGDVHLKMEIWAIVWDAQTQLGYRPTGRGSVLSRPGVLEMTYILTNLGTRPVLDLKFYQYLHPHPNGSCFDVDDWGNPVGIGDGRPGHLLSAIKGAYDPKLYEVEDTGLPGSEKYHFDLTLWAQDLSPNIVGTTVGMAALEPPSVWGMGDVGIVPIPGQPVPPDFCAGNPGLIWCQVETNSLPSPRVTRAGPPNIGGVLGWELPRLNAGHSVERHVILALSDERPPDP